VEANLEAGSITLAGPSGPVALVWKAGEKDRGRALPPGAYRPWTVRVERMQGEEHWFLSSTGAPGKPVEAVAGRALRLTAGDEVRIQARARRDRHGLDIGFGLTDSEGRGISVYRDDRRVSVAFRVLSMEGKALAEGTMTYG